MLNNHSEAEEVTQDVFLKMITRVEQYDGRAEAPDKHQAADDRLADRQRKQAVRKALSRLSDEQREALILARYHGMPYAEIALTLNITEGAVKTRIFRAIESLKEMFSEGGTAWNAMTS
jgi:RNA polymerase sigma-70 factor (ECF subfamily)